MWHLRARLPCFPGNFGCYPWRPRLWSQTAPALNVRQHMRKAIAEQGARSLDLRRQRAICTYV